MKSWIKSSSIHNILVTINYYLYTTIQSIKMLLILFTDTFSATRNRRMETKTNCNICEYRAHWRRSDAARYARCAVIFADSKKYPSTFYTRYVYPQFTSLFRCAVFHRNHEIIIFRWWFIFEDILMGSVMDIAFRLRHEDGKCTFGVAR